MLQIGCFIFQTKIKIMKKIEIKKTVLEIFDKLYEHEKFQEWWDTLSDKEESEIENSVKEIIERRLKQNSI
jgi:L-rhamnose mutarotase